MKTFMYKVKDGPDKIITGEIEAYSKEEAVNILCEKGYTPIFIKEYSDITLPTQRVKRLTPKLLMVFFRQLSLLLKSGVPIIRSLKSIEDNVSSKDLKLILRNIINHIENGGSLSSGMEMYPEVFTPFYTAMVRAGEESASLDKITDVLYKYQLSYINFTSRIKKALFYPSLILILGIFTIIFLFLKVIPTLSILFNGVKNMPISTQIIFYISKFIQERGGMILLFVFIIYLIYHNIFLRSSIFRFQMYMLKLRLLWWGDFILKSDLVNFLRTLSISLDSGIQIIRAWEISLPVIKSEVLRQSLEGVIDNLKKGGTLSSSLKNNSFLPSIFIELIRAGEMSGRLGDVFNDIRENWEKDCEDYMNIFLNLLEPILIIIIGGMITLILSAVILPILDIESLEF